MTQIPPVDLNNLSCLQSILSVLDGKQVQDYTVHEQRDLYRRIQPEVRCPPGIEQHEEHIDTSYGKVQTLLYKPCTQAPVPVIFFLHGGGFIFGTAREWEDFIYDLVGRTGHAVVFPEYTLAPEAKFPAQHEQCLEVLQSVVQFGPQHGLAVDRVTIAGDSVGAQLALNINILNRQRGLGIHVAHQLLLHPCVDNTAELTDAPFTSKEYREQQLTAYFTQEQDRGALLASPGLISSEQVKDFMPTTTIILSDVDGFRVQGEAFARRLQKAGIPCGVICAIASMHDFEIFSEARKSLTSKMVMAAISEAVKALTPST